MASNSLKFIRSYYLKTTSTTVVVADPYFSSVEVLLRGNLNSTSTSVTANPGFSITDSTSPTNSGGVTNANYLLYETVRPPAYFADTAVYSARYNYDGQSYTDNYALLYDVYSHTQSTVQPTITLYSTNSGYKTLTKNALPQFTTSGSSLSTPFNIECWVYVPVTISTPSSVLLHVKDGITLKLNSNKTITASYSPFCYYIGTTTQYDGPVKATAVAEGLVPDLTSAALSTGWHHIAFNCSYAIQPGITNTGTINLFVDGTRQAQHLNLTVPASEIKTWYDSGGTSSDYTATYVLRSPSLPTNYIISAVPITGIRIITGGFLTSSNFTPPTQKVTSNVVGWNGSTSTFSYTSCYVTHFTVPGNTNKILNYSGKSTGVRVNNYTATAAEVSSTIPTVSSSVYTPGMVSLSGLGGLDGGFGIYRSAQQIAEYGRLDLSTTTSSASNFTVNFFFNKTASGADYLWNMGGTNATGYITLITTTGTSFSVNLRVSSTTTRITASSLNLNTWYYVHLTRTWTTGSNWTYSLTIIPEGGTGTTYTHNSTATISNAIPLSLVDTMSLGGFPNTTTAANSMQALFADFRLTKGVARGETLTYPKNFHPTTS